jgi:uncharacterized radical SAM protein YgiQ
MFIPATREEAASLGWETFDVIIVSGDAYIDICYNGAAVIGHVLINAGYRVGMIAQPDISSNDITRLGEPGLFWGVSGGSVDSMISNYTSLKKLRSKDDLTPGGKNTRRPDRAVIAYSNLIRRYFKNTAPIVIGGIEASLRRFVHYDYWDNKLRRCVLADAKADILVYGMGERTVLQLADAIANGKDYRGINSIAYLSGSNDVGYAEIPSYLKCLESIGSFEESFLIAEKDCRPGGRGIAQDQGGRYVIVNPPADELGTNELDRIYELPYERELHPFCAKNGRAKALETIRFSLTSHRGCFGGCAFCAISQHQGRRVVSRSHGSISREINKLKDHPLWKGNISDVGGPTANMFGMKCLLSKENVCGNSCLYPQVCENLLTDHALLLELFEGISAVADVKKVFVASGVRHDLVLADEKSGAAYLKRMIERHISGQMKIAPEHISSIVLKYMIKPSREVLERFIKLFNGLSADSGTKCYLTYYFMTAHPGCAMEQAGELADFTRHKLRMRPVQTQVFTPSPGTLSSLMYYTGRDPFTGDAVYVEKDMKKKLKQKELLLDKSNRHEL